VTLKSSDCFRPGLSKVQPLGRVQPAKVSNTAHSAIPENSNRNRKFKISTALKKAKSWEPAYSQALIQTWDKKWAFSADLTMQLNDLIFESRVKLQPTSYMLIVTIALHHNLEINSLLFSHYILGKLIFLCLTHQALRRGYWGHWPKNFGDPCFRGTDFVK